MQILGAHKSIAGGLHRAFERGDAIGCDTMQIWVKNPRQWHAPPLTETEIRAFQAARRASEIAPVIAHAAYLINIASPKPKLWEKSIRALIMEVERCEALDVPYLVLHPGAHTGSGMRAGLERAAQALDRVHAATPGFTSRILLETMAGQGTTLGGDFEGLAHILDHVKEHERLGICLDTCHVFAAGYDLRTAAGYEATITAFEQALGLDRLQVIHLNDSRHPLSSHKDRHAHIGAGELGAAAFRRLLNDPRLAGIPGILETPKGKDAVEDRENLALLQSLIEREAL